MSATTVGAPTAPARAAATRLRTDPAAQAFLLLRIAFTVAPILFGLDKFANVLRRLDALPGARGSTTSSPATPRRHARRRRRRDRRRPRRRDHAALRRPARRRLARRHHRQPADLLGGYYDIALRDFGLMLGALTLARLATVYDR